MKSSEKPDSVSDIFRTAFFVVQKTDGFYQVLFITAAPGLQEEFFQLLCETPQPGVAKFTWTRVKLESSISLLRKLGYYVLVYSHTALFKWLTPLFELEQLPERPNCILGDVASSLPACNTYVELFGGCTPLFLFVKPAPVELINDYRDMILHFFRMLRDPITFGSFFLAMRIHSPLLLSPTQQLKRSALATQSTDEIPEQVLWYKYLRQLYSDASDDLLPHITAPADNPFSSTLAALRAVDPLLAGIHSRLYRMQIEFNSFDAVVKMQDSKDTLFWVDPPWFGKGSLNKDTTHLMLRCLSNVQGHIALFQDGTLPNPHLTELLETEGLIKEFGWKTQKFGNSIVYRNS